MGKEKKHKEHKLDKREKYEEVPVSRPPGLKLVLKVGGSPVPECGEPRAETPPAPAAAAASPSPAVAPLRLSRAAISEAQTQHKLERKHKKKKKKEKEKHKHRKERRQGSEADPDPDPDPERDPSPGRESRQSSGTEGASQAGTTPSPEPGSPAGGAPLRRLLEHLLRGLREKDTRGFFSVPVTDEVAPGYSSIIDTPMDFSTIATKIREGQYAALAAFKEDFRLMCCNAMTYNRMDTIYYRSAKRLLHIGSKMMSSDKVIALRSVLPYMAALSPEVLGVDAADLLDQEEQQQQQEQLKQEPQQQQEEPQGLQQQQQESAEEMEVDPAPPAAPETAVKPPMEAAAEPPRSETVEPSAPQTVEPPPPQTVKPPPPQTEEPPPPQTVESARPPVVESAPRQTAEPPPPAAVVKPEPSPVMVEPETKPPESEPIDAAPAPAAGRQTRRQTRGAAEPPDQTEARPGRQTRGADRPDPEPPKTPRQTRQTRPADPPEPRQTRQTRAQEPPKPEPESRQTRQTRAAEPREPEPGRRGAAESVPGAAAEQPEAMDTSETPEPAGRDPPRPSRTGDPPALPQPRSQPDRDQDRDQEGPGKSTPGPPALVDKPGFLRRRSDGTTSLAILAGSGSGHGGRPVATVGALTGRLQQGQPHLPTFRDDKRNQAKPVKPLQYGAYSSFAPSYDSSFATISHAESGLLFQTLDGGQEGTQLASSVRRAADDCDLAIELVDSLLDALTAGQHRRQQRQPEPEQQPEQQEQEQEQQSPEVDFSWLRSLREIGIDVGFLDGFEAVERRERVAQSRLDQTSELLSSLHSAQLRRLSLPPEAGLPPPSQQEIQLADEVTSGLADLVRHTQPGQVAPQQAVRKAMGVGPLPPGQELVRPAAAPAPARPAPAAEGGSTPAHPSLRTLLSRV